MRTSIEIHLCVSPSSAAWWCGFISSWNVYMRCSSVFDSPLLDLLITQNPGADVQLSVQHMLNCGKVGSCAMALINARLQVCQEIVRQIIEQVFARCLLGRGFFLTSPLWGLKMMDSSICRLTCWCLSGTVIANNDRQLASCSSWRQAAPSFNLIARDTRDEI